MVRTYRPDKNPFPFDSVNLGMLVYTFAQSALKKNASTEFCGNIAYTIRQGPRAGTAGADGQGEMSIQNYTKGTTTQENRKVCMFAEKSTIMIHSHFNYGIDYKGRDYIYSAVPSIEDIHSLIKDRSSANPIVQYSLVVTYLGCWVMTIDYSRDPPEYDGKRVMKYLDAQSDIINRTLLKPQLELEDLYKVMDRYKSIATTFALSIELVPMHTLATKEMVLPVNTHVIIRV